MKSAIFERTLPKQDTNVESVVKKQKFIVHPFGKPSTTALFLEDSEYSDPEIEEDELECNIAFELDIRNLNDPFKVPEIADEIFINDQNDDMLDVVTPEQIQSHYKHDICGARNVVVSWVIYIAQDYSMGSDTLYQAVAMFDYVLSMMKVPRKDMHICGITCLWMSAKINERCLPKLKDMTSYFKVAVPIEEFVEYEKTILKVLDFQLSIPTPKIFLRRYIEAVNADKDIKEAANFFCELTLWNINFYKYHPDIQAISAVAMGHVCINRIFPKNLILAYSHNQDMQSVKECCLILLETANSILSDKKNITYQRYLNDNLSGVVNNLNLSNSVLENL